MPEPLLQDLLIDSARRFPESTAIICDKVSLTYAELERRSNAAAHGLSTRGVGQGDRVVLFAENRLETVILFWAALKAGAIVMLIHPQTKADKLAYYVADSGASLLFVERHLLEVADRALASCASLKSVIVRGGIDGLRELTPRSRPGGVPMTAFDELASEADKHAAPERRRRATDIATIIYTSGSSGIPKGVMLTHRNMLFAAGAINTYLFNTERDVILSGLPLSFDYGLYQMLLAFQVGARLVLERSFGILPRLLARLATERATGFPCLPTIIALLAELPPRYAGFPGLRYVTSSGAALLGTHIRTLERFFPNAEIFSMFGLTECKRCTYLPPQRIHDKPTSVGIAIPGTQVRLVDEHDRPVSPGDTGQLVVLGDHVMAGYWNKPEATRKKLKPGRRPGERLLYTGDICRMDDEGYLYFVSRMDDIIKSRGEKISPLEIERVLLSFPGITQAAVLGRTDAIQGYAIAAFVAVDEDVVLSEQELRSMCSTHLEPSQVPGEIHLLANLPLNANGKVDRQALARLCEDH